MQSFSEIIRAYRPTIYRSILSYTNLTAKQISFGAEFKSVEVESLVPVSMGAALWGVGRANPATGVAPLIKYYAHGRYRESPVFM